MRTRSPPSPPTRILSTSGSFTDKTTANRIPRAGLAAGDSPTSIPATNDWVSAAYQLVAMGGWLYRVGNLSGSYEAPGMDACLLPDCSQVHGGSQAGFGYQRSFGTFLKDPSGVAFINTGNVNDGFPLHSVVQRCSLDGCSSLDTLAARPEGTYQGLAADKDYFYVSSSQRNSQSTALLWSRVQRVKKIERRLPEWSLWAPDGSPGTGSRDEGSASGADGGDGGGSYPVAHRRGLFARWFLPGPGDS